MVACVGRGSAYQVKCSSFLCDLASAGVFERLAASSSIWNLPLKSNIFLSHAAFLHHLCLLVAGQKGLHFR